MSGPIKITHCLPYEVGTQPLAGFKQERERGEMGVFLVKGAANCRPIRWARGVEDNYGEMFGVK